MKMDDLVQQRFSELTQKAEELAKTRGHGDDYEAGVSSEKFTEWATSVLNLLQRIFGEDSIHYKNFQEHYKKFNGYFRTFVICRGILNSAKEDYEGGYLFNTRALIQAEVFDDVLEQASELWRAGYKDGACVIAGVTLETTLKELCSRKGIPHGKLDRMNADLCKANAYNMGMQKQITAWAERRNKAAHGEWGTYTEADVENMIRGVTRLIAEYL